MFPFGGVNSFFVTAFLPGVLPRFIIGWIAGETTTRYNSFKTQHHKILGGASCLFEVPTIGSYFGTILRTPIERKRLAN